MTKALTTILSLVMVFTVLPIASISASALSSGWCGDNVKYSFSISTGKLVISGKGDMYDNGEMWLFSNNSAVKSVVIKNGVTNIGISAFEFCNNLKSVKIGKTVKRIGDNAFYDCEKIKSVKIPNSVQKIGCCAFFCCTKLKSVKIGKKVKTIGMSAFVGTKVKSLKISKKVKTIGKFAFYECMSLKSITIPKNVKKINKYAFGYYYNHNRYKKIKGFTIKGKKGSVAQKYAKKNGFKFKKI